MATKEDYQSVAPYVMSIIDVTAEVIENKLASIQQEAEPTPVSDPVKADIVALFNYVYSYPTVNKSISKAGGINSLASTHNMTPNQCKTCIKEFEAMRNLYQNPITE